MTFDGSFSRLLSLPSLPRYAWWRLRGRRSTVGVALRNGPRFFLRPANAGNTDYGVAYDIFVHRNYACPWPLPAGSVSLIVDLGANVGLSCLYWLTQYPRAKVVAMEPHPRHFVQCRINLAANNFQSRVELHRAAAGVSVEEITLSDDGTASAVLPQGTAGLTAPMLDVFSLLSGCAIDILKLDIEGGEYPILGDPRFAMLRPRCVVMEWHGGPSERDWCFERFATLGYDTKELFDNGSLGMLWAFRRTES